MILTGWLRGVGVVVFVLGAFRLPPTRAADAPATAPAFRPFGIQVVDEQTGRGVPLVELKTVSNVRYVTDSNGWAAIDDPTLVGRRVFFFVSSHGYDFPADGFGSRGRAVDVTPGGLERFKIKRVNIAERLYRVTGEGIYRDSVLLGRRVPIREPLLNAQVAGQDSVQRVIYRGKIHWFWGDTARQSYPLGHFWMAGATSELPGRGGLDPSVGIDLDYFTDVDGFSRPMVRREAGLVAWMDALVPLRDGGGVEKLYAVTSVRKGLAKEVSRRLDVYNDAKDAFDPGQNIPLDSPLFPTGHPVRVTDAGTDYFYFPRPFPDVRVKADEASLKDLSTYEAFTPLAPGSRYAKADTRLERDAGGRLVWAWKRDTAGLDFEQIDALVKAGKMKADEAWFRPADADTGKPVRMHGGSVEYNNYRTKWVMIAVEVGGASSHLGEVWYAEADKPEGPWPWARKIVTHDRYSFYNPAHHPFLDQVGGRLIYFEGTYATTFSRDDNPTPRYDYNQVMYRLDLADPRLAPPATRPVAP